jgi:type II secretory pathway pseudopilin PulG
MQTGQQQFSVWERLVVVAIILFVATMLIQKVLHSVKASERRSLDNAAGEYAGIKNMYAGQRQIVPPSMASAIATDAASIHNAPVR